MPRTSPSPPFETTTYFPSAASPAGRPTVKLRAMEVGWKAKPAVAKKPAEKRKAKGAKTWTPPFVLADQPDFPDTNPTLFLDRDKRVWLFWQTIVANQWETAINNYRIASAYGKAGVPHWDRADVLLVDKTGTLTLGQPQYDWLAQTLAASAQLARAKLTTAAEVERAYVDLLLVRGQLLLLGKLDVLWREAETMARTRYEVGQGPQSDLLRAQLERTRLRQRRLGLEADEAMRLQALNRLAFNDPAFRDVLKIVKAL